MFLKYIKYHNFRPFIGDQKIDLTIPSSNPSANTIVILGDNTFGKSTFVLSFIWCFYGVSKFQRPKDILNKKVENNMRAGDTEIASVEIAFEDNGIDYVVKRTQKFKLDNYGFVANDSSATITYVTESGETKQLGRFQNEIYEAMNSILPINLSSFFFFEGEKNNEIGKKDLATSVKTLLGLDSFDRIITHMYGNRGQSTPSSSSVMGYYMSKMNSESDTRAKEEFKRRIDAEEKLSHVEERLNEIADNISNYDLRLEEINKKILAAAPSNELKRRRSSILLEIKDKETELQKANQRIMKIFGSHSLGIFLKTSLPKAQNRMSEMNIADKGIKGIEGPAIHELLKRGTCLCGTDLSKGTMAYKCVEQYIEFLPPKNVGSLVSEVSDSILENEERCSEFAEEFEEEYKSIQKLNTKLDELHREEKDVLSEIGKIGNVNTEKIEDDQRTYKNRINSLREEERKLIEERVRLTTTIETATKNFNLYKSSSEKAKSYNRYYQYAKAIYESVLDVYDRKEKDIKTRLSSMVSTMFNNMYSGNREVSIDNKYNIVMKYKGDIVDDTGGLRVIQYFSYVGGLVKLAAEIRNEQRTNDGEPLLGEQYPLVLDAAFSHADDKHIRSISKELANATGQLVFALMVKDWLYAEEGLSGKIARKYELKKIDETEVQIVEVK